MTELINKRNQYLKKINDIATDVEIKVQDYSNKLKNESDKMIEEYRLELKNETQELINDYKRSKLKKVNNNDE